MRFPTSGSVRTMFFGLIVIVMATVIVACGSGTSLAPVGAPAGGDSAARAAPAASAAPASGEQGNGQGQGSGGSTDAFRDEAKIIRTGSLQLEVTDVRAALRTARDTITAMGGYIGASQQSSDGDSIVATVTYRIPVERWEEALESFRNLGEEVGEQTDAAEVTDQIVDLDARIRNLKASETALVRHASEAVKISDLLEIETRLSDVRGQIEQLTAQKQNLEDKATFATLTVTFGTEVAQIQQTAEQWDPKGEVDRAGASLLGFLQALTSAGIWFAIVWVPILFVLGITGGVIFLILRRLGFLRRTSPSLPPPPPAPAEG
jgi:hypothetical protein